MKVTYEFNYQGEEDDYYQLQIFERAPKMCHALHEIESYMRELRKGYVEDDVDKIVDKVFDMIFESNIGEIE